MCYCCLPHEGFAPEVAHKLGTALSALALGRQPGVRPVLLAPGVVPHAFVTHARQLTGGFLRGRSFRVSAIDYYVRILVRQNLGRQLPYLIGRQVQRARQVSVLVLFLGERLDEDEVVPPIQPGLQVFS